MERLDKVPALTQEDIRLIDEATAAYAARDRRPRGGNISHENLAEHEEWLEKNLPDIFESYMDMKRYNASLEESPMSTEEYRELLSKFFTASHSVDLKKFQSADPAGLTARIEADVLKYDNLLLALDWDLTSPRSGRDISVDAPFILTMQASTPGEPAVSQTIGIVSARVHTGQKVILVNQIQGGDTEPNNPNRDRIQAGRATFVQKTPEFALFTAMQNFANAIGYRIAILKPEFVSQKTVRERFKTRADEVTASLKEGRPLNEKKAVPTLYEAVAQRFGFHDYLPELETPLGYRDRGYAQQYW
jgi:hypothetical protein